MQQRGTVKAVADVKIFFLCGTGKTVPGADQLAVIAAIDPVAEQRAQRFRYGVAQFNGQVGDAQAGIQFVRPEDRAGRTDIDAGLAAAAVCLAGGIQR